METRSIRTIVQALKDGGVRYLIAGGIAVVAHGYVRYTADLDLILDLTEANLRPAVAALAALGYRPTAPVPLEAFSDEATRSEWIHSKGLTVLSLHSPEHPAVRRGAARFRQGVRSGGANGSRGRRNGVVRESR